MSNVRKLEYTLQDIRSANIVLYLPDRSANLDVYSASMKEFISFVTRMLEKLYPITHLAVEDKVFQQLTTCEMDDVARFVVIDRLARIADVKDRCLIERKRSECLACKKMRRGYVPAHAGNGKYCRACFMDKVTRPHG